MHIQYGDGEELEEEFIQQIRSSNWRHAITLALKQGDLIVLDNLRVQHARIDFTGERRLAVVLCK